MEKLETIVERLRKQKASSWKKETKDKHSNTAGCGYGGFTTTMFSTKFRSKKYIVERKQRLVEKTTTVFRGADGYEDEYYLEVDPTTSEYKLIVHFCRGEWFSSSIIFSLFFYIKKFI